MNRILPLRTQTKVPTKPSYKCRKLKAKPLNKCELNLNVYRSLLYLDNHKELCDSDKIDRLFPPQFPENRMERRDINRDFSILDNNKPFGRNEKLIFKILSNIKSSNLREFFLRLVVDYLEENQKEFI